MATKAIVSKRIGEDKFKFIIVENDGYINNPGVGNALAEGFTTHKNIDKLFKSGNLKSLRAREELPEDGNYVSEEVSFEKLLDLAKKENVDYLYMHKDVMNEDFDKGAKWHGVKLTKEIKKLEDLDGFVLDFLYTNEKVDREDVDINRYCSYLTAVNWLDSNRILFNKAIELDQFLLENVGYEEDENGEIIYKDFFQYYLTRLSDDDVKWMNKTFPDVVYAWSEILEKWVLCVDHYGTSWDYVSTEYIGDLPMPEKDVIYNPDYKNKMGKWVYK